MSALDYLPAISMGTKTSQLTGNNTDGFVASGYASLIQSITGTMPTLVPLPNKKARIILSEKQTAIMKKWFEGQVSSGIKLAKAPSNLELVTGPFIMPTVLKYAVPALGAVFFLGWIASTYFGKR